MEPNQNMPMDPNAMGQEATPAAGQEMASPEEVGALKDMMDQIEEKYREMNADKFAGSNQVESMRKDLIVEVFKALQTAGIDITNVDEVKKFLDDLEQSNPDLYEIFVDAFNGLLGGEGTLPGTSPAESTPPVEGMSPAPQSGALGNTPGSIEGVGSEVTASNSNIPSNNGLSGMIPGSSAKGLSGRFPNLAK